MKRSYSTTILLLFFLLALGLLATNLAFAQWKTQKTPPSVQNKNISDSPSIGPADAPVVIGVFTCFQ